ncbi:hypothetical protein P152DRAFT_514053 [Eremomyces bilateralis CBS 781.70]|uniref:Uncharacterized protein n=1 Tax=Eremomyces bilateralis CBS 781.70 TaxID=1392243 RepID=A0A6G1G547_9PEZI|nr:uncharacterized protein P152DRAFT_514053 [Eremomyces bilateralis CBS 781.70]KAF1813061.1 hypothetical protein P152DRAFT_514053 [Eremomyces bilateralis CBS 781.70]
MEPVSAVSTFVGLTVAAGKICEVLKPIVENIKDVPRFISSAAVEVADFHSALTSLQSIFSGYNFRKISIISVVALPLLPSEVILLERHASGISVVPGDDGPIPRVRSQWTASTMESSTLVTNAEGFWKKGGMEIDGTPVSLRVADVKDD